LRCAMKFCNATELLTVLATQRFSFSVDHLGAGNRQSAPHRGTGSLPRYFEWSGLSDIGTKLTPLRRRKMSAFKGAAVISLDQLLVSKWTRSGPTRCSPWLSLETP
jgi:hypothetical protein